MIYGVTALHLHTVNELVLKPKRGKFNYMIMSEHGEEV